MIVKARLLVLVSLLIPALLSGQSATKRAAVSEPPLPVIDYKACPFEGCTFGKWIVTRDSRIFSTWREPRTTIAILRKGEIVIGLTGVHITYEPDHVRIMSEIPALGVGPGDTVLRYMYRGEGFCDLWIKGLWHRDYDCTFIAEKSIGGCLRDCSAQVTSNGRKDWWVRLKTPQEQVGWARVDNQFDCMDAFGGDPQCDKL